MNAFRRSILAVVILGAAGCQEPPRTGQMDMLVTSLAHLKEWDPIMQGRGQYSYDAVMGYGPEIYPVMVAHLTDETPTIIHEPIADRTAKISDVVFLMLLQLTRMKWEDFSQEGVFVSTALPNPIFCIKWDRMAKFKVQARFQKIVEEMEKP